jgi:hypothetical protein
MVGVPRPQSSDPKKRVDDVLDSSADPFQLGRRTIATTSAIAADSANTRPMAMMIH